ADRAPHALPPACPDRRDPRRRPQPRPLPARPPSGDPRPPLPLRRRRAADARAWGVRAVQSPGGSPHIASLVAPIRLGRSWPDADPHRPRTDRPRPARADLDARAPADRLPGAARRAGDAAAGGRGGADREPRLAALEQPGPA